MIIFGRGKQWSEAGERNFTLNSGLHLGLLEGRINAGVIDLKALRFRVADSWEDTGVRGTRVKEFVAQAGSGEELMSQVKGEGFVTDGRAKATSAQFDSGLLNLSVIGFRREELVFGKAEVIPLSMGAEGVNFEAMVRGRLEHAQAITPGAQATGEGPGLRGAFATTRENSFNLNSGINILLFGSPRQIAGLVNVTLMALQSNRSYALAMLEGKEIGSGQTKAGNAICVVRS